MSLIQLFRAIIFGRKEQEEIENFLLEFPEEEREIIKRVCLS